MDRFDVIVLGAGAAGLMAGIEAARRGRRVVVIDHAEKPGEKIRISGGGRCNFTNVNADKADRFLGRNPRFALSALRRFTPRDIIARVEAAGIAYHEKTLGQLFCDGSAVQVVKLLTDDLARAGGALWTGVALGEVRRGQGWELDTARGRLAAESLIVATGGKSIPKMGATGFGLKLAESLGLPVTETRPGLVPLTFATQDLDWIAPMAGLSLPVRGRAETGPGFDEALLFTHRGLSGPAILQLSSYWREGQAIHLNLCPGREALAELQAAKREQGRVALRTGLLRLVPEKLARHVEALAAPKGPLAELSLAELARIGGLLADWTLVPVGSEGWRTAEVMLGGVETEALDARTMEAKGLPGLYFVGEVVDITGWLGGYNFQWAWASGWAAGQVA